MITGLTKEKKKPHDVAPGLLHEAKGAVSCSIVRTFVLSRYVFEEVTTSCFKSWSVINDRYKSMLQNYFNSELL